MRKICRERPGLAPLSPRQRQVLACREQGYTYKETAGALGMSYSTVKFHLRAIFAKWNVESSAEAVFLWRGWATNVAANGGKNADRRVA